MAGIPPRLSESPLTLIRRAIGGPRQIAAKLGRCARTARLWLDRSEVDRRLQVLRSRGVVDRQPTRLQILFGGWDMLRFVITPAARDYYEQRGISFRFHVLLRILDDPMSMVDPTGFLSERETITGHVMQVVHLNPIYDLQLLQMFPDGLESFEREVEAMVAGTHPRAGTIGAIVEEPGYHQRLLAYVRRYRGDPDSPQMIRQGQTLRGDPVFDAAERTFATLPGFLEYCDQLPSDFRSLLRRLRRTHAFPLELAAPAR